MISLVWYKERRKQTATRQASVRRLTEVSDRRHIPYTEQIPREKPRIDGVNNQDVYIGFRSGTPYRSID